MSRTLLLSLLLGSMIAGCRTYHFRDYTPRGASLTREPRIATVGFYPFRALFSEKTYPTYNQYRITYEAVVDYAAPQAHILRLGTPVASIAATGIDTTVPQENIRSFITDYLSRVKKTGLREMRSMFQEGPDGHFLLQKRPVDFYVVGVHLPAFQEADYSVLGCLSIPATLLTFGAVPWYRQYSSESVFLVYDASLRHLKTFTYRNQYNSRSRFHTPGDILESPPAEAFHQDIREFHDDLVEFLNSRKP